MKMSEKIYVFYRKIKALSNTILLVMFRIIPIKKNKISITTFEGKGGYGCNPKYIVEELHRRDPNLEFVWIVNDMNKPFPDYVRKVPNTLWSRNYHLATSHIWIDNYRKPYGTTKRKGQFYLQTWHAGIGFKRIGLYRGDAFSRMAYLVSKNDSDMIDLTITDTAWTDAIYEKGLIYKGPLLRTGAPRCDTLLNPELRADIRTQLRNRLGLAEEAKILLFAPTYREADSSGRRSVYLERWGINFERTIQALSDRFGGDWALLIRLHPQIADEADNIPKESLPFEIYDVSREDDMYEILSGVDALITDYSSTIFEASLADIPAFMYADDIDEFTHTRGGLNFDFSDMEHGVYTDTEVTPSIHVRFPYQIAQNNDELDLFIRSFDLNSYLSDVRQFEMEMGIETSAHASSHVADLVQRQIYSCP